jgi:hypothetical protein
MFWAGSRRPSYTGIPCQLLLQLRPAADGAKKHKSDRPEDPGMRP